MNFVICAQVTKLSLHTKKSKKYVTTNLIQQCLQCCPNLNLYTMVVELLWYSKINKVNIAQNLSHISPTMTDI
jgi:hypothetical protein